MPRIAVHPILTAALVLAAGCGKDTAGVAGVLIVAVVEVTPPDRAVVVGETIQLSAVPKTEGGIPLPGRDIVWSSADESRATVSPTGLVRAGTLMGPVSIRASVSGVTGETRITVVPVPVARIVVSPDASSILVGQSIQLTARAFDINGAELPDRSFAWASSANAVAAVTTTGIAIGMTEGGPVSVTASAEGKAGSATVVVARRPPTRLGFVQHPGPAIAGLALTPALRVAVQDALSATVTDAAPQVTIALGENPGAATLSGTRTVTAVNGIATFSDLVVDRAGPGYTLVAASAGLTAAISTPFAVAAGAANHLALIGPAPAAARIGIALQPAPTVEIRDGSGNPVHRAGVGIVASVTGGNGIVGGTTTATTGASGTAVFSNLSVHGSAGTVRIAFSSPGIAPVTTGALTFSAGNPARLHLLTPPSSSAQSGLPLSRQPVLRFLDGSGNPVALGGQAIGVTLSAAPPGGALVGPTIIATDAGGVASFTDLALIGPAGSYVLAFAASGLPLLTSPPIALSAGAGAALSITTQPFETSVNHEAIPRQPVIQLRDAANNPVSQAGVLVTASIQTGGGLLEGTTTVVTNAAGTAVFTDLSITGLVGSRTMVFAASGYVSVVSTPVLVQPGAPARLSFTTMPSASARSGVALGQQPVVRLEDLSGNAVTRAGLAVTASIGTGGPGGTLTGTTVVTTDGAGVARFTNLTLHGPPGSYTLAIGSPGLAPAPSSTIALNAGVASALAIITQPSGTVLSGSAFAQQPVLQLQDANGNAVPQSGVLVTASIQAGGGTLGGTTTVATDPTGSASFTDLSIAGATGVRTLSFAASGAAVAISGTIMVTAGAASQLSVSIQPPVTAQSSVAFAQQPVILVRDGSGNAIGGVTVTVAIASGGGALSGATTATSSATGLATFAGLAISGVVGDRTLSFAAPGLTPVSSAVITLTAGPAAQLDLTTPPSATVVAGATFPQQPVLQLRDGAGNPVAQGGVVVTASIQSGAGVLGGTTAVTTSASGAAAFTDLSIGGLSGPRTLSFSASGITGAVSAAIVVGAAPASQLFISIQPSVTAQSSVAFSQQPVVLVRDGAGNPVGGVAVTAAIASGGGSLSGNATAISDAAGLAAFTGLGVTGTIGGRTLSFSAAGLPPVTSTTIALIPGPATQLVLTTQPSATVVTGATFPQQPVLQLRDGAGNPVAQGGVLVTASIQSGGGVLGGATAVTTNASGAAGFTDLMLTGAPGPRTLFFGAGNIAGAVSAGISLVVPSAPQLIISVQPATLAQNAVVLTQQPVILLRDGLGNPAGGVVVTATIVSGGGALGGTVTATSNASGLAIFTDLVITGTVGSRTLGFAASSFPAAVSNAIGVTAGAATHLTITTQPSTSVEEDEEFPRQPVIQLRDVSGNAVGQAGVSITASINSGFGSGKLKGTTTVTTDAAGVARFTDLEINNEGFYTIRFTSGGLAPVISSVVIVDD